MNLQKKEFVLSTDYQVNCDDFVDSICYLFELVNMLNNYDTKYSFVNIERLNCKFNITIDKLKKSLTELKGIEYDIYIKKGGCDEVSLGQYRKFK